MPLALIATDKEEAATSITAPALAPEPAVAAVQTRPPPVAQTPLTPIARSAQARVKASPAARAYAREHGIDLAAITPGKPGGAILRADAVRGAAAGPAPARKTKPGLDFDKMRHAIAAAMARSKREIPHYYLSTQINLRCATEWLAGTNRSRKPEKRLLMNVLLLKAVAQAVKAYPRFNGFYLKDGFMQAQGVHIGPAIAIRGGGLIAPAIHDCDQKSLDEIMIALRDLVARVRAGSLRSSEMSDPAITVTALGERGVDGVFGVIFPPQVAIVGFGAPHLAPVAHADGGLAVEPVMLASLAADHRVTDGHLGARFLSEIAALLQEPEKL